MHDDLLNSPDSTNGSPTAKTQKRTIHQVSQSDNPTKITIKTFEVPSTHQERTSRKRRQKEFQSPNSESRIDVVCHDGSYEHHKSSKGDANHQHASTSGAPSSSHKQPNLEVHDHSKDSADSRLPMCSITISFDLNTQKLWDDLHLPYETYTSFFRHLILLEKYFRNGDLVLSDSASTKASSYIRSLQNRIEEFEVKHKRSHADLSASTRPDLSVPPAPGLLHLPAPIVDPPSTRGRSSDRDTPPASAAPSRKEATADQGSTILKIPKVSMPSSAPEGPISPPMPTKIRVRSDLKFIGLEPNKPKPPQQQTVQQSIMNDASHQLSAMASQVNNDLSKSNNASLMQLLNDPTLKQKQKQKGPTLGNTPLVAAGSKSSNSQLFKSSGDTSSSSAIPLTFNNSIAEVLAAAAKSKSMELMGHLEATSKPDVTITAKSVSKNNAAAPSSTASSSSQRPSYSSPKIHTSTTSSHSSTKDSVVNDAMGKVNPLMDMSKLLQSQAPGIPPHIIAQNTLAMPTTAAAPKPISTHQMAGTMPKIAPKPTSSLLKPVPVVSNKPTGIQTVNKKSLNTVLDRLGALKSSSTASAAAASSSTSSSASNSSLVQQLQAPPMMTNPGLPSSPSKSRNPAITSAASASTSTLTAAAAASMPNNAALQAMLNPLSMGFPGTSAASAAAGLLSQPMTANPWSLSPAAQQQALASAMAAMSGMSGMSGMNQVAAMNELLKMSMQASQQVKPGGQRLRAPPPLTHMGRPGGPNPKPKNPE